MRDEYLVIVCGVWVGVVVMVDSALDSQNFSVLLSGRSPAPSSQEANVAGSLTANKDICMYTSRVFFSSQKLYTFWDFLFKHSVKGCSQ